MPYYKWCGVELTGTIKTGRIFARSVEHLDALLFKREIALLKSKCLTRRLIKTPIRLNHKIHFFQQLSVLVDAGVLLPEALALVAEQIEHTGLREVAHDLADSVQQGIGLSKAMQRYPRVFNQIMVQLIKAGEESGKLPQALDALCSHVQATHDFYLRLRSALLLPGITFAFFMLVVGIIFVVIIPQFAGIFASAQVPLPALTKTILAMSNFMNSRSMLLVLLGLGIGALFAWRYSKSVSGKRLVDKLVISLPFIGPLLKKRFVAYFLRAVALLLEGGVHVVPALRMIAASVNNRILREYITELEVAVTAGSSLSDAMARHSQALFSQDIVAMAEVGQESGRLASILKKGASSYHAKLVRQLSLITMLVQPTIMIILGLLVALLVFAIYVPIFELSSVV